MASNTYYSPILRCVEWGDYKLHNVHFYEKLKKEIVKQKTIKSENVVKSIYEMQKPFEF